MPEYAIWTLIISLAVLSFGMTLKIANLKHTLKLLEKENNRFIEEITMVKNDKDKAISGLSKLHQAQMKIIIQEYEKQIKCNLKNTTKILDKYHRLVPPARLAFIEALDKDKNS